MQVQNTIIRDHGPEFNKASALIAQVHDHRFIDEAIEMARAAFAAYDGTVQLVHRDFGVKGQMSYHNFFRKYTPDLFRFCRNVKSAANVLEILIAQQEEVAA